MKKKFIIFMTIFFVLTSGFSQELTGLNIMQKASNREKALTDSFKMRMTLISANGKKRVRELIAYSKNSTEGEKTVMIVLLPSDVKGTGYLSYTYSSPSKPSDRWLYIPALKKVKRLQGSSDKDSFMGSEFSYSDISGYKVEDYTHTLLGEEKIHDTQAWKIESVPLKKSMYSKYISWIDKTSLLTVKSEFYDGKGELLKVLTISSISKKEGFWTSGKLEMHNVQTKRTTIIDILKHEFNKEIPDSYFKVNSLEAGKIR